jgi:hypothetical protein
MVFETEINERSRYEQQKRVTRTRNGFLFVGLNQHEQMSLLGRLESAGSAIYCSLALMRKMPRLATRC